jgi:hypothetical protein
MVVVTQLRGANSVAPSVVLPNQAAAVNQALMNSGNLVQIRRLNGLGNSWFEDNKTLIGYGAGGLLLGGIAAYLLKSRM